MIIVKENNFGKGLNGLIDEGRFSDSSINLLDSLFLELKPRIDTISVKWLRNQLDKIEFKCNLQNYFFLDMRRKNTRFLRFHTITHNDKEIDKENVVKVICYNFEREDIEKLNVNNKESLLKTFDLIEQQFNQFYNIDDEVDDLYRRSMEGYSEWLKNQKFVKS